MTLRHRCPVGEDERIWIEESLDWLAAQFGPQVLHRDVLAPEDPRFPRPYRGGPQDVRRMTDTLFDHLGVDRDAVAVQFQETGSDAYQLLDSLRQFEHHSSGAAGHYRRRADGRPVIDLTAPLLGDAVALAHELGHHRLLGEGRIEPGRRDGEPLTDLLTVYFGAGHFNANAAHRFTQDARGWRRNSLGYLSQPMFGYALARYAWLRDEPDPAWARLLDTNPRGYLREGLRYLRRAG